MGIFGVDVHHSVPLAHPARFHNLPNADNTWGYRGTPSTTLSRRRVSLYTPHPPTLLVRRILVSPLPRPPLILRIHVPLRCIYPSSPLPLAAAATPTTPRPFSFVRARVSLACSLAAKATMGFSGTGFTNSHAQPRLTAAKSKFLSFRAQSIVPVRVCVCARVSAAGWISRAETST